MLNHQKLICYRLALELARHMPALIGDWPGYLSDQLKRALSSIVLNIGEGNGRTYPKERKRFFAIARGSATEVASIIDFAHAIQLISSEEHVYQQDTLLQIVKMLWKLP